MSRILTQLQQQQLINEVNTLKDYVKALETENSTRNQERKILQKQIERLTNLERQGFIKTTANITQPCSQCFKLKSQIQKLQNHIQRLTRENTNLHSSYNALSETLAKFKTPQNSVTRTTIIRSGSGEYEEKYKELAQKYDSINFENMELKKDLQKYSRINIPGLEQKIRTSQKQNASLHNKISSLETQINNLKLTLSTKVNEILSSKAVTTAITTNSSLQYEIKALKQSLAIRDKQLIALRQKTNVLTSVQLQLRNAKSVLASKQAEIVRLKQQSTKIIRTIDISSNDYDTISSLELQIKNLKNVIVGKDVQISSLINKNSQISFLKGKITHLEGQVSNWKQKYNEQVNRIQTINKENTIVTNNEQILSLNAQISHLQIQTKEKDEYIQRIEDELKELLKRDEEKNIEVNKLDMIVNTYMERIGELQIQINRLHDQHNGTATFVNTSSAQYYALTEENKTLNIKIFDLERRIQILEQTNAGLREQLRVAIQMRSRETSRVVISSPPVIQQKQFLNTIKMLTKQNQNIKAMINKLKTDNQYLQAKLASAESQIQNLAAINRNIGNVVPIPASISNSKHIGINNRIIANMPAIQSSKISTYPISPSSNSKEVKIQHKFSVLDDNQRDPLTSVVTKEQKMVNQSKINDKSSKLRDRPQKFVQVTNIGNNVSNGYHSKQNIKEDFGLGHGIKSGSYQDLQRKIQLLKQENKGLRKNLYDVSQLL